MQMQLCEPLLRTWNLNKLKALTYFSTFSKVDRLDLVTILVWTPVYISSMWLGMHLRMDTKMTRV